MTHGKKAGGKTKKPSRTKAKHPSAPRARKPKPKRRSSTRASKPKRSAAARASSPRAKRVSAAAAGKPRAKRRKPHKRATNPEQLELALAHARPRAGGKKMSTTKKKHAAKAHGPAHAKPCSCASGCSHAIGHNACSHARAGQMRRKNPETVENPLSESAKERLKNAGKAIGIALGATLITTAGAYGLSKMKLDGKAKNVAANLAAGTLLGGAVGLACKTGGALVGQSFVMQAANWMLKPDDASGANKSAQAMQLRRMLPPAASGNSLRTLSSHTPVAVSGVHADVGEYEQVESVHADVGDYQQMQSVHADVGDYQQVQGVHADVGDYQSIEGIQAALDGSDTINDLMAESISELLD